MRIMDIKIGDRSRRDLGDIRSLADSINRVGLLHSVVVLKDGTLIAGARRIAAFRLLGKDEIPHRTVDSLDDALALLTAERDENTERKDFTPSEAVAMAERLEPLERAKAAKRMKAGKPCANSAPGKSRDLIAKATGFGRTKLAQAKAVIEASKQDPERFGPIAEKMDETGNVHGAFKALAANAMKTQIRKMAEESRAELEEATAWMSPEQKAALGSEMMRQRGEFTRLVEDIAEKLRSPEEFADAHQGYIQPYIIEKADRAHKWLGRFLKAWRSDVKSA